MGYQRHFIFLWILGNTLCFTKKHLGSRSIFHNSINISEMHIQAMGVTAEYILNATLEC